MTVAILGIIAVLVLPNLLDSMQKVKQKRTVADIRDVGTSWYSWLTDQISAASTGSTNTYDFSQLDVPLTADELLATLYVSPDFFYIQKIGPTDGWGHDFDFAWSGSVLSAQVLGIRSFGRDDAEGPDATNPYAVGPFDVTAYDEDIVWADGLFIRYPAGASVQ